MSADSTQQANDLDEDLFNFDELYEDEADESQEMDVEAFLAAAGDDDDEAESAATEADVPPPDLDADALALPTSDELERLLRAATEATSSGPAISKPVMIGAAALVLVNVIAFVIVMLSQGTDTTQLESVQRQFEATAAELRSDIAHQVDSIKGITTPTAVVPLSLEPEIFDRVRRALDEGDLPSARRQLYAALSTVDRLEPEERSALEAEAGFLLADTYRIEADRREERVQ